MIDDHHELPELTDGQQAQWRAAMSDMREMSARLQEGAATREDVHGALNHLLSCDIDRDTLLNALHLPTDSGPYASALEKILRRIPDGWGRWISHDAGWYPIVIACDERLAALDPDYVVHQVKEKFGLLCYYCAPSGTPNPRLWEAFHDVTSEAERVAAVTCERCGQRGALHRRSHWVKTLCSTCAESLHYTPAPTRGHNDGQY